MQSLSYAIARTESLLAEVSRLSEGEFAYDHSRAALELIEGLFKKKLETLKSFDEHSNPATVGQECTLTLSHVFNYVPLLGIILRSTNVRNAFELFRPLLRLARQLLEPDLDKDKQSTCLVLSSEWDYSPLVYPSIPHLPGFVLIGMPAPESSNPLLVPLAGHELGHAVWVKRNVTSIYSVMLRKAVLNNIWSRWGEFESVYSIPGKKISKTDLVTDFFCLQFWEPAFNWAMLQCEESFCDFIGLRLFGESYLHAFAYLLSPGTEGRRSLFYPSARTRVENLVKAAKAYGIAVPNGYVAEFDDSNDAGLIPSDTFRLAIADQSLESIVDHVISMAGSIISHSKLVTPTPDEADRIYDRFEHVIPAEGCKSLSDIINAGWKAYLNKELWKDIPQVYHKRVANLMELILKNIEIFEIETIISE